MNKKHKSGNRNLYFLLLAFFSLALSGCYSNSVQYQWGWTTRHISGVMKEGTQEKNLVLTSNGFIVVQEYYALFAPMQNAPLYVPRARLIFPDSKGNYEVNFDLKASKIELHWIASGYAMQRLFFQRQIGVGDLQYQAFMQKTEAWKEHFSLHLIPFLQKFIVEESYKMPSRSQLFLGDWIAEEQKMMTAQNLQN